MPITISGSTGITGINGSANTPALQGTDTNTGIYFGTDIVAVSTGGTERMRVDSGGRITMPGQPMFYGYHGATVSYSANQIIQITSSYDPLSMFSGASNYRVTVPVAGRYLVLANLLLNTGSAGALSVNVRKNGSNQIRFYSSNGYAYQSAGTAIILNCAANDYIDLATNDAASIFGSDIGNFTVVMLG
jgi:hypothetical protein